ncbi:hypothetical protein Tco_0577136, partial [Tanacetum coccineum]
VMSSASSAVTYTSVYTDNSEPGRVFWVADDLSCSGILNIRGRYFIDQ